MKCSGRPSRLLHRYELTRKITGSRLVIRRLGICALFVGMFTSLGAHQNALAKAMSVRPELPNVHADSPPDSGANQSQTNSELKSWQIENLRAQSRYYNRRPSLLERLSPWASGLAALVAFVTLVVNYRSNIQTQRDTKFYEALKRFGDKDSPSVRISATLLLAEMSQSTRAFTLRKKRSAYLSTVLQQFVAGMMLEKNPVVLETVHSAFSLITRLDAARSASLLFDQNRSLAANLVKAVAEFLSVRNVSKQSDIPKEAWVLISGETGFPTAAYEGLLRTFAKGDSVGTPMKFDELLNRAIARFSLASDTADTLSRRSLTKLRRAADLMRANIQTCSRAWPDIIKAGTSAGHLFLPGSELRFPIGSGVSLHDSNVQNAHIFGQMPGVYLSNSDLRGAEIGGNLRQAWLQYTDLRGASLAFADIQSAAFFGALVDANTSIRESKWWRAQFGRGEDVDTELITKFFQSWRDKYKIDQGQLTVEGILAEAHASVKPTLETLLKTYRSSSISRDRV